MLCKRTHLTNLWRTSKIRGKGLFNETLTVASTNVKKKKQVT